MRGAQRLASRDFARIYVGFFQEGGNPGEHFGSPPGAPTPNPAMALYFSSIAHTDAAGEAIILKRRNDGSIIAKVMSPSELTVISTARVHPILGMLAALALAGPAFASGDFTRGVGVYPGDPAAFDGPVFVTDSGTYRNVALHRPATASSNYDFSLTAQLVTDGIIDTRLPAWLVCSTSARGVLPRSERENVVDGYASTSVDLPAAGGWVQVEQAGRYDAPAVDHI
jgi:hypothetical protein